LTEPDNLDLVSELSRAGDTGPTVVGVGGSSEDVAVVRAGLRDRGYAVGTSPAALAHAVRALVDDARTAHRRTQGDVHALAEDAHTAHRRTQTPDEPQPTVPQDPARGLVGGPWDEDRAKGVLDGLGIRTPARVRCESVDAAYDALAGFGGPVAVKLLDASVLHKTEIGGVHLGIRTREELADALEQLERAGAEQFLMEAMAAPGVDLIVGVRRDPVFGPVVLVGLGGAAAEALADVAVRAVPLSMAEAESMPDELLGRALLDGWRNGPVLDRSELAHVLRALASVLVDSPAVDEIEINPLRLTRDGLVALDAVITANDADDRGSGREEM
jgi:acyl-CoA synthetase (NDP forming)